MGPPFVHIKKRRKHAKNVTRKPSVNTGDDQHVVVNVTDLSIVIMINYVCVAVNVADHRSVFIIFIRRTVRHVVDPLFVNIIGVEQHVVNAKVHPSVSIIGENQIVANATGPLFVSIIFIKRIVMNVAAHLSVSIINIK